MTETPQPEKKIPLPELLSVFLLTCGALILFYAGYLWISANLSIGELRDQEKELRQTAVEEVQDSEQDHEAVIAAAKEEQDALKEEIKSLHEELEDLSYDERGLIEEEISEISERLAELQREINEEKAAARDKPSRKSMSATDRFEAPFELKEKISLAKTLALISLFFIVPGLLLRVPALLQGA